MPCTAWEPVGSSSSTPSSSRAAARRARIEARSAASSGRAGGSPANTDAAAGGCPAATTSLRCSATHDGGCALTVMDASDWAGGRGRRDERDDHWRGGFPRRPAGPGAAGGRVVRGGGRRGPAAGRADRGRPGAGARRPGRGRAGHRAARRARRAGPAGRSGLGSAHRRLGDLPSGRGGQRGMRGRLRPRPAGQPAAPPRRCWPRAGPRARKPVVVFASSLAVFGNSPEHPLPAVVDDQTMPNPQTSYGVQKVIGEQLLADYTRKGFLRGRAVRLMTVSVRPGPAQRGPRPGSCPASSASRWPASARRARSGRSTEVALSSPGPGLAGLLLRRQRLRAPPGAAAAAVESARADRDRRRHGGRAGAGRRAERERS